MREEKKSDREIRLRKKWGFSDSRSNEALENTRKTLMNMIGCKDERHYQESLKKRWNGMFRSGK